MKMFGSSSREKVSTGSHHRDEGEACVSSLGGTLCTEKKIPRLFMALFPLACFLNFPIQQKLNVFFSTPRRHKVHYNQPVYELIKSLLSTPALERKKHLAIALFSSCSRRREEGKLGNWKVDIWKDIKSFNALGWKFPRVIPWVMLSIRLAGVFIPLAENMENFLRSCPD